MEEQDNVVPELRQATVGLEEGLETCQKIVSDYRSALLSVNGQTEAPAEESSQQAPGT